MQIAKMNLIAVAFISILTLNNSIIITTSKPFLTYKEVEKAMKNDPHPLMRLVCIVFM